MLNSVACFAVLSVIFMPFCEAAETRGAMQSIASCAIESNAADGNIDVGIRCPRGVRYRIVLEQTPRCAKMRSSAGSQKSARIHYVLLTPDRSGVWCDGTNGTKAVSGVGTGGTQHYVAGSRVMRDGGVFRRRDEQFRDTIVVYVERQ